MAKLKVGVIGLGSLGSRHAHIYYGLDDVELVGLCDIDTERLRAISDELKVPSLTDYRKLIGKIDAASIVVPTKKHYAIAKDFLKSGVHLLIEKPIAQTVDEADRLLKVAKEKNLVLTVGHVERFNAAVESIHKLRGDVKFIECHRLGPFAPRVKDVGVVLDLMIHDIDIILDLIRSPIKSIDAVGVKILTNHEDIANARITFKNNAVCNITASRVTAYTMRKIRMFQPNAYISLDYVKQDAVIYSKKLGKIVSEQIQIEKENSLQKEITAFIECVRTGKKPLVSGIEGRDALAVATEILRKINHK